MDESKLLELLDLYIDMVEKQDEAIRQLSEIIRKQSYEIAHMRNLYGFTEENTSQIQGTDLAKAALERYIKRAPALFMFSKTVFRSFLFGKEEVE